MSDDEEQLRLDVQYVPLTDAEKMERGAQLAHLIREAALMALEHADRRKAMKDEKEALEFQIAQLADVLRTGQEERPIGRGGTT